MGRFGSGVAFDAVSRTRVVWKWEDEEDDGEGVGPVWVDVLAADPHQPEKSEKWDRWVRRSEAARFAEQHGFEFVADE
jgi:hypothetical protein